MLTTPTLTASDVDAFERDGFLVARGAFGGNDMALIQRWCDEVLALPEEPGRHWVYHERSLRDQKTDLVSRIENIAPFHDGFAALSDALKVPAGMLLGEDAVLFKEKINFKMPGGDGFAPHQDSQAGWDTYADFFISVLVCIDPATEQNGCLKIAAGHHNRGLFKKWEPLSDADMADMDFISVPTQPGDLIFFDCFAPHASEPNMTEDIRRLYYATYNRHSAGDHLAQYYADKHKNYPPDIDRDPDRQYIFKV